MNIPMWALALGAVCILLCWLFAVLTGIRYGGNSTSLMRARRLM